LLRIDFLGGGDEALAVAIQPDGKIVAAGTATNGTQAGLGLFRVLPCGRLLLVAACIFCQPRRTPASRHVEMQPRHSK
jgi:hypothetical protein